jgi:Rap1a immunity proteins
LKRSLLIAAILASVSVEAHATLSGLDLYEVCVSNAKNRGANESCDIYMQGFIDGIVTGTALARDSPPRFCPPSQGIPLTQGRLIAEKFFRDHPEWLNHEAGYLLSIALAEAFPCPAK